MYEELNLFLNDICVYLEKFQPYLLKYIKEIVIFNNLIYKTVQKEDFKSKEKEINLTFQEAYNAAREIIGQIDENYLTSYDKLIDTGILEFSYNHEFFDSHLKVTKTEDGIIKLININRSYNLEEIKILVHEFMHYTVGNFFNDNREFLSEFLAIYFEEMSISYLQSNFMEEVDYECRLRSLKRFSNKFYGYGMVLFSYVYFGNIDDNTFNYVKMVFPNMTKNGFEKLCNHTYKILKMAESRQKRIIEDNPLQRGKILADEFMAFDYLYIIGITLSIYAHKYCDFKDILYLNNNIEQFDELDIEDVLRRIGIDIRSPQFLEQVICSLNEYIGKMTRKDRVLSLKK